MAKIQRVTGKIFGGTATATGTDPQIGQFGSALAGTYLGTTDISAIQGLPAWGQGFIGAVTTDNQFPALPEVTGFGKVLSQQQCYLLQQGVAEWDSATTYYTGNFCAKNSVLYVSLTDENLNNDPESDTTNWELYASGSGGSYIGQLIFSILPQTEAGLHLLDGTIIDGAGVYSRFVDYIKNLYNDSPTASYFTTEADWQLNVSTYGVCGKFVYNASANTVRLPKVTGILEGTIDASALGDLVEAGLPAHTHTRGDMNITGTFGAWKGKSQATASGAFNDSVPNYGSNIGAGSNDGWATYDFDASNSWTGSTSNPNYTADINTTSTVQPQTIKGYYYIVVATSTKTDIEVDIDNVVTDLNGKVNKSGDTMTGGMVIRKSGAGQIQLINTSMDKATPPASTQYNQLKFVDKNNQDYGFLQCRQLSNNSYLIELGVKHQSTNGYTTFALGCDKDGNGYVVASGAVNQYMAKMPMPSSRYIDLTLGASGTAYTAPANGWFYLQNSNQSGRVQLRSDVMGVTGVGGSENEPSVIFPTKKGESIKAEYYAPSGSVTALRFIYAEGEV